MTGPQPHLASYLLACSRPWGVDAFLRRRNDLPGRWRVVTHPDDLSPELLAALRPRYVFFPHWSWIVPDEITDAYECVCFHITDVPFGRGGSPLQNLISRGIGKTVVSALQMTSEPDAGPVYGKRLLGLSGSAEEIYRRAMEVAFDQITWIVDKEPLPVPQQGEPVHFARRKPEQSALPAEATAQQLYDHIRMLDAEGYPHAFLKHGSWHLSLTNAELDSGRVMARVMIEKEEGSDDDQ